ncbi:MAG: type II toxin-antitoxin system RelE/ParE family toxin [Oceanicaulis sp.]
MADWTLSAAAIRDLQEIAYFTGANWGVSQSDAYLEALYAAIYRMAEYPELGVSRDPIAPGLRMAPVRSHRLYFRREGAGVVIVRVLHGAQDEATELRRDP